MGPINKGKIFLKAAFRALVAGAEDLPLVGLPIKMGRVFYDQWIAGLKQAQDAVPEIERPLQLEAAAICTPAEAKVLALDVISETKSQGRVLSQAQEEAVLDVATVFPARVRERTHATLDHAKSQGTAAHVALPVSAKAPVLEREDFYRSLLPLRRPQFRTGDHLPHYNPEWRLVELIGAGGFGEVWLARHDYLGETRAIKFCQDPTGTAMLLREAENINRSHAPAWECSRGRSSVPTLNNRDAGASHKPTVLHGPKPLRYTRSCQPHFLTCTVVE